MSETYVVFLDYLNHTRSPLDAVIGTVEASSTVEAYRVARKLFPYPDRLLSAQVARFYPQVMARAKELDASRKGTSMLVGPKAIMEDPRYANVIQTATNSAGTISAPAAARAIAMLINLEREVYGRVDATNLEYDLDGMIAALSAFKWELRETPTIIQFPASQQTEETDEATEAFLATFRAPARL